MFQIALPDGKKISPTYQQSLFNEVQLGLPEHDAIVRWTENLMISNPEKILSALEIPHAISSDGLVCAWSNVRDFPYANHWNHEAERYLEQLMRREQIALSEPPPIKISKPMWECPIKNKNGTMIGFVDLMCRVKLAIPSFCYEQVDVPLKFGSMAENLVASLPYFGLDEFVWRWPSSHNEIEKIPHGMALSSEISGKRFVLFGNKLHYFKNSSWSFNEKYGDYEEISIYVEAKTEIKTAGELLRQMQFYKGHHVGEAHRNSKYMVVAPPSAWKEGVRAVVEEQGFPTMLYGAN